MKKILCFLTILIFCFGLTAEAQKEINGRPIYYERYIHENGIIEWPTFMDEVVVESQLSQSLFVANVPELRQAQNAGVLKNIAAAYNTMAYSQSDLKLQQDAGLTKFYYLKLNTRNLQDLLYWRGILQRNPNLKVTPSQVITTTDHVEPKDPLVSKQWYLKHLEVQRAFNSHVQGKRSVIIAIGDTGVDTSHEDIPTPILLEGGPDDFFHGTWVASIAMARFNNGVGGTGIAPEEVFPQIKLASIKLLRGGNASLEDVATDLLKFASWARKIKEQNQDVGIVLNLSIGGIGPPGPLEPAIKILRTVGVVVVASAGNNRANIARVSFVPAAIQGVIAVAATDANDNLASFSNYGGNTFIAAPGTKIWGAVPKEGTINRNPSGYDAFDGTSAAAPMVSANVALFMWSNPTLPSEDQIRWQLYGRSNHIELLNDKVKTSGRINIGNALTEISEEPALAPFDFTATDSRHSAIWTEFTAPTEILAYIIHYSTSEFEENNLNSKEINHITVTKRIPAGEKVTYVIQDLKELSSYYLKIQLINTLGLTSPLSHLVSYDTRDVTTYSLRTFEKNGKGDPGNWLVIDGPYASAIEELFGTNYQLWHIVKTNLSNPSFVWRFGVQNASHYNVGQPTDSILLSEIYDLRGLRGGSIKMKWFQNLTDPSRGSSDIVELNAFFPDDSNRLNLKNAKLLKSFGPNTNNTEDEFPFKDLVVDFSEVEGKKIVFGLRFLSLADRDAFGIVFGNVEVRVDKN